MVLPRPMYHNAIMFAESLFCGSGFLTWIALAGSVIHRDLIGGEKMAFCLPCPSANPDHSRASTHFQHLPPPVCTNPHPSHSTPRASGSSAACRAHSPGYPLSGKTVASVRGALAPRARPEVFSIASLGNATSTHEQFSGLSTGRLQPLCLANAPGSHSPKPLQAVVRSPRNRVQQLLPRRLRAGNLSLL